MARLGDSRRRLDKTVDLSEADDRPTQGLDGGVGSALSSGLARRDLLFQGLARGQRRLQGQPLRVLWCDRGHVFRLGDGRRGGQGPGLALGLSVQRLHALPRHGHATGLEEAPAGFGTVGQALAGEFSHGLVNHVEGQRGCGHRRSFR